MHEKYMYFLPLWLFISFVLKQKKRTKEKFKKYLNYALYSLPLTLKSYCLPPATHRQNISCHPTNINQME